MLGNINDWYELDMVDGSSIRSMLYILKRGNLSWIDPWLNTKYGWQLRNSQMEGINKFQGDVFSSPEIPIHSNYSWNSSWMTTRRPNECNAMLYLIWQSFTSKLWVLRCKVEMMEVCKRFGDIACISGIHKTMT